MGNACDFNVIYVNCLGLFEGIQQLRMGTSEAAELKTHKLTPSKILGYYDLCLNILCNVLLRKF